MMSNLQIGQINVAKSNVRQHVIFNSLSSFNFHIICVQECWMGEVHLPISFNNSDPPSFSTVSHPSWVSFHPSPSVNNLPKVCIYVRKDIAKFFSFSPIFFQSSHFFLLKFISQSHLPSFNILNVYCLPGANDNSCFRELLNFNIPVNPTLVVGDFNLQHPSWGSPIDKLSSKSEELCLYFADQNLFCINVLGVQTRIAPNSSSSSSIIDLSLINDSLANSLLSFNWMAHSDFGFNSSDHLFIEINFEFFPPPSSNQNSSSSNDRFSFNFVDKILWSEHFSKFSSSLHFSAPSSCADIDSLVLDLHNCFSLTFSSIQSSVLEKKRKNTNSSSSTSSFYFKKNDWWNNELQNAHIALSSLSPSDPSFSTHQFAYKQLVIKTKKDHFKKIIDNCTEDEIWSLRSWCTKPRKNSFLPFISFSSGPAVLNSEIAQGFFNEFFSPPNIFPVYSSLALDSPPLSPRNFIPITLQEIENALKPTSNSSAPGHSQISYKFIKYSFPFISSFLLQTFNSILDFSYHPLLWHQALVVVIPKPNKPDYSSPRAYRPISLLECFSKLLEKIIANRLSFDSIHFPIIPP